MDYIETEIWDGAPSCQDCGSKDSVRTFCSDRGTVKICDSCRSRNYYALIKKVRHDRDNT